MRNREGGHVAPVLEAIIGRVHDNRNQIAEIVRFPAANGATETARMPRETAGGAAIDADRNE